MTLTNIYSNVDSLLQRVDSEQQYSWKLDADLPYELRMIREHCVSLKETALDMLGHPSSD